MKISIITVCFNSEETIVSTLNSVLSQTYHDIEHIIIDGGSTDRTTDILHQYNFKNKIIVSEPDEGIYDAMNKGIKLAKGDVITILNSDDIYQSPSTISDVMKDIVDNPEKDIFLGDVVFFNKNNFNKIFRYYSAKNFRSKLLLDGIMPPHPSSFIKKKIYNNFGLYKKSLSIAADFEMFLRLFIVNKLDFFYTNKVIVRMRSGGKSGKNLKTYFTSTKEIVESFKINNLKTKYLVILARLPLKFSQFFFRSTLNLKPKFEMPYPKFEYQQDEEFRILKSIESIPMKSNFILSGMNLAFLGFFSKGDVYAFKTLYHWPDGIFAKNLKSSIEKIPGRLIVNNLLIPDEINKIYVIGNCSERSLNFLKRKYKSKSIKVINLPYGNIDTITKSINLNLEQNSLVYITLPTPKQEQLAYNLARNNKHHKIICIGASIMIASGEEKVVPKILENFEFLWRLRTDTLRRLKRLYVSFYNFAKGKYFSKKFEKIKVKIID